MRTSFLCLLLPLAACAPETPVLGGLTLASTKTSFSIKAADKVLLESSSVVAPVATRVGRARYEMQYGSFRITDNRPEWTEGTAFAWDSVTKTTAKGTWRDANDAGVVSLSASSTGPGELAITYTASNPQTNRLSLAFSCAAADRFLGFGAQADGVDHRGHTVAMWTSEPGIGKQMTDDEYPDLWFLVGTRHASSFGLPTWTSNRGYQGLVGSDARSLFEVCSKQEDVFRIEVWSNKFTLWLYEGTPAVAVSRATRTVLGRPLRPPPMAFAPWNDAVFGPAEVRRVAGLLRDNDIPSSAIWTEDFRGATDEPSGYRLTEEWDTDRTLYPDVEAVAAELHDGGYSWQAYFNTFVVDDTRISAEAKDGGHLVGSPDGGAYLFSGVTFKPTGLADLSRPETREWVKSYLRKALDLGFTGWMADYGEWLPHDAVLFSNENPLEAHNRYAREWAQLNQEVMDERAADGRQRLFFARAGWLGSNSVTPVVWAGDQRTSFQKDDGLPTVIPMGINLGLAGVSMYAHDVAGYQSATNPPSTKELFFRWTSLGALTPVMRTHHGIDARRNWKLDSDAETLAHYKRWAQFHIQLYPYLDAHSAEAEATGVPIVRALAMLAPGDDRGWTISDEYFLGGGLLVAPVIEEGAVSRSVYLPDGEWVSWDGATRVTGPVDVVVPAAMGELPVFLRKGTCIPRLPSRVETLIDAAPPTVDLNDVKDERVLFVVPGGVSDFLERDGTRYVVIPGDATSFAENDAALPDCAGPAERGCVDRSGLNPVARLKEGKPLDFPGGYLTITGGPARKYDVEVLRQP
ncbi:MAG: glycoside hydrolase family 31 protein [Archangium sp.]|nr:glycoside hydrolase family 31 protein [Archangium sp.]